jgi:hypothetical protein
MKSIYILLVVQICIFSVGKVYSQETPLNEYDYPIYKTMLDQNSDFSSSISSDSLDKVYKVIDQLSMTNLIKIQESYRYRCRIAPNETNKAILEYINLAITSKRDN